MLWVAALEFTHTNESSQELSLDVLEVIPPRTEKFSEMVRQGIPHSLRPQMWLRMSGAYKKKQKSDTNYKDIVKASSNDGLMTSKLIEKDLLRIMPTNVCFSSPSGTGIPRLRRILRGLAWLFPDIGYVKQFKQQHFSQFTGYFIFLLFQILPRNGCNCCISAALHGRR